MIFWRKNIKTIAKASAVFLVLAISAAVAINLWVANFYKEDIYKTSDLLPHAQAVMILGARVYSDGRMSDMLKDRVDTALEIYRSGKAEKVLMSGDHSKKEYDEINPVKDYLLSQGVPPGDLFLDHAGLDTFDSVYRAQYIFQIKTMIISTQDFHLPRAVYLARSLGIEAWGISADKHVYANEEFTTGLREAAARIKAWFDISFSSKPKFLGEKIPITGDSSPSWDEK